MKVGEGGAPRCHGCGAGTRPRLPAGRTARRRAPPKPPPTPAGGGGGEEEGISPRQSHSHTLTKSHQSSVGHRSPVISHQSSVGHRSPVTSHQSSIISGSSVMGNQSSVGHGSAGSPPFTSRALSRAALPARPIVAPRMGRKPTSVAGWRLDSISPRAAAATAAGGWGGGEGGEKTAHSGGVREALQEGGKEDGRGQPGEVLARHHPTRCGGDGCRGQGGHGDERRKTRTHSEGGRKAQEVGEGADEGGRALAREGRPLASFPPPLHSPHCTSPPLPSLSRTG